MSIRHRSQTTLVASGLALGAIGVAFVLLWHPWPTGNRYGYGDVLPIREELWLASVIDGAGFAVLAICFSVVVCALAQTRGAVWASVGSAVTTLGGIAFAMGEFAFAALSWYATDTSAIAAPAGTKLLKHTIDHTGHGTVVQVVGFLAFSVGTILLLIALIRARTVPLWLPITFFVMVAAEFAPLPLRLHDFVQVGLLALLVVLAWMYARSEEERRSSSGPAIRAVA